MLKNLAEKLGPYPVTQITARDILLVLTSIEKSGRVESALATRAAIGRVFRFAIATARPRMTRRRRYAALFNAMCRSTMPH